MTAINTPNPQVVALLLAAVLRYVVAHEPSGSNGRIKSSAYLNDKRNSPGVFFIEGDSDAPKPTN